MTTSKDVPADVDLAVRRIVARYCHLVDDRDFDALVELFTEDARYRLLDDDLVGRSAIRSRMEAHPDPVFHHVTNVVVSNGSQEGVVHAVSDCLVGRQRDGQWSISMLGRYHDTLVGQGRDMRFSQRILTAR